MSAHIDFQIIEQNGKPAFAVLPWTSFERMRPMLEQQAKIESGIPGSVVKAYAIDGKSLVLAWREHLGLSQAEVAGKAGMKQPALSRIEKGDSRPHINRFISSFIKSQAEIFAYLVSGMQKKLFIKSVLF